MKITLTIPEDKKIAVIDAFALQYKYQDEVYQEGVDGEEGIMIPNPVNKGQFAKNIIRTFIKEVYISAQVKPVQEQGKVIAEQANIDIDTVTVT